MQSWCKRLWEIETEKEKSAFKSYLYWILGALIWQRVRVILFALNVRFSFLYQVTESLDQEDYSWYWTQSRKTQPSSKLLSGLWNPNTLYSSFRQTSVRCSHSISGLKSTLRFKHQKNRYCIWWKQKSRLRKTLMWVLLNLDILFPSSEFHCC